LSFHIQSGFERLRNQKDTRNSLVIAGAKPLILIRYPSSALCLLFFLLCLFQLLPLPEALLKAISPSSLAMYRDFSNGPADAFHPVSLNRMQLGRHSFASSVMQPYFLSLSATTAPRIKYIPW
jgi:hypothetical protein